MSATGASTEGGAVVGSNRAAQDYKMKKTNILQQAAKVAVDYVKGGGLIGMGLTAIGKANKKSRQNLMDYEGRAAGVTPEYVTYSNNNNNNGSGSDTPTQVAKNIGGKIIKSPTTAEVSQSNATDAAAYDNRKIKAKGRSMTILTSSRGVKDNTLTLGKKSLLGI